MDVDDGRQTPDDEEMEAVSRALEEEDVAGTRQRNADANAHIETESATSRATHGRCQLVDRSNPRHVRRLSTSSTFHKITYTHFSGGRVLPIPQRC